MDLGIEVILALFSKAGLANMFEYAKQNITSNSSQNTRRIFALKNQYLATIEDVIAFLQGHNQTFARQVCSDDSIPQASRFDQVDDLDWAFGIMGMQDRAKYLCTLYLEDLSDFIVECVDSNFGFSRYAERLGRSANSFDEMYDSLQGDLTFTDKLTIDILEQKIREVAPKLVCLSVPFPGNLYSAFRCAQFIKANFREIKIAMGGGFPNTELRSVSDARVFDFFDYITLDDGELPLEILTSNILDPSTSNPNHNLYKRTFLLEGKNVIYNNYSLRQDYKQSAVGTPDYSDLMLNRYISVIEIANPMHSLWSDGRWNKLTMAHGCYWGKCTFCDISLDYIGDYQPVTASLLVDRMEEIIAQTGEKGFHFVDEAAPPALMREVALEILRRNLVVSWWTNIRFEKSFTWDLCQLLKASGCIAVSGGLEVASDRLLALIQKGVTVEQVAQVTRNFTEAGIMVHAYLMYGYPTQTEQETVDSLEMVRQLFELGIIQSGFWHQFALTAHSPVGLDPDAYGVIPNQKEITFANNDIDFVDSTGVDHSQFSDGLKKSLFNYMHGVCFDFALQEWFETEIPETLIPSDYIQNCLDQQVLISAKSSSKIYWLGGIPEIQPSDDTDEHLSLSFHFKSQTLELTIEKKVGLWFVEFLSELIPSQQEKPVTFREMKMAYQQYFGDFEDFWGSAFVDNLCDVGLIVV